MVRFTFALAAVAALAPTIASAFELTETPDGTALTWSDREIPYAVRFALDDPDGQHLASATRAAFDTWAFASRGALAPTNFGPRAASDPTDRVSTASIDATWDPAFGDAERAVAFAWVQFDPATGRIREGDVHLNGARFEFGSASPGVFDTESVVLHELGHVLGLAHSCGLPGRTYPSCFSVPDEPEGQRLLILEAVMAPTLSPGTERRAPNPDDLEGLAVHFSGSATTRPEIVEIGRDCPSGEWRLRLREAPPGDVQVRLRYANGVTGRRDARVDGADLLLEGPEPAAGPFDVVVTDPTSGTYDARVDVAPPARCTVAPPPDAGTTPPVVEPAGCRCVEDPPTESRRRPFAAVMLVMVLIGTTLRRRAPLGLLVLAGVLLPDVSAAFECSRTGTRVGPSLIWDEREVSWYAGRGVFDLVGDRAVGEAAVLNSFKAWEDVECSDLTFPFLGEANVTAGFDEDGENHNVVVLIEQLWPYQAGAIAVTTTAYDVRNGVVVDADIEFNASTFIFEHVDDDTQCEGRDNVMDLQNTLTHEVGHVIGLEHPPNTARYAETTMFASAPSCEIRKRTLAEDDREGLCFIYPAGGPTTQCYPPEGPSFVVVEDDDGFGGCRAVPSDAPALWGLLLIGLAIQRRRR